jgi:arylsulfatase A-like enzyme
VSFDNLRAYPAADAVVDRACSWLDGVKDAPFFLWLHFMDPHHPYYPPPAALAEVGASHISPVRARFLNSFWNRGDIGPRRLQKYRRDILSLYDAGVYWVDKQISRLVCTLQQTQRWEHTVFALTGDHGEEFLEHGTRYHYPTNLAEQLIHVPLLLRAPGLSAARITETPFSLIHLAPTLLQCSGVAVPDTFQGRSYWNEISAGDAPSEPAIAECIAGCNNPMRPADRMRPRLMAIRDHQHKLVIDFGRKTDRLYDLKTDPSENTPLESGVFMRERARLLQAARAHLQKTSSGQNSEFAMRARLRELKQAMGVGRKGTPSAMASD